MPSKTSFFNKTTFRKDLTRYFPLWGLYTLCLLLGLVLIMDEREKFWIANNFAQLPRTMAVINLFYALAAAAVLFGDLYNTRMCYGLHALPLSRRSWFVSHILSGLCFSLIPTAIMAVVALPMLAGTPMENGWQLSPYWFLISNLQYLFFFSLAAFCVQCAGNWLGMAAVYGLLNFGSYIIYILVNFLFTPLLPGVITPSDTANRFCPVLMLSERYLETEQVRTLDSKGIEQITGGSFTMGDAWGYLLAAAAAGLVLLIGAYLLYRRRKLESAGDFLAIRQLAPVLAVAMALAGAAAFQVVSVSFGIATSWNSDSKYQMQLFFSFACMAICWFAGQMLLSRSTQVFRLRQWAGLAVLTVVIGAALGLTKMDVLGIADWVPQPEDVQSVYYFFNVGDTLEDEKGIADMIQLHKLCLEEKLTNEQVQEQYRAFFEEHPEEKFPYSYQQITLTYELKNGHTAERIYFLRTDGEASEILKHYSGTLGAVFGIYRGMSDIDTPEELLSHVQKPESINIDSFALDEEYLTAETVKNLFEAIIADCEAGNMSQIYDYHPYREYQNKYGETVRLSSFNLNLFLSDESFFNLDVYTDCENILSWMESVGITQEMIWEERIG